jgi:hypothetical protein
MENSMSEIIQYAPYILIMIMFCANYQIFVTPSKLEEKLRDYVLKETHDLAYAEMKNDISEMKNKIDKMYDKIMGVG